MPTDLGVAGRIGGQYHDNVHLCRPRVMAPAGEVTVISAPWVFLWCLDKGKFILCGSNPSIKKKKTACRRILLKQYEIC